MRLNAKRVLLIEPDEFQALVFKDLEKNYSYCYLDGYKFNGIIDKFLECDIDFQIEYTIEVRPYLSVTKEERFRVYNFSYKISAFYGGDELEYCVCWTDNSWNEFLKLINEYL